MCLEGPQSHFIKGNDLNAQQLRVRSKVVATLLKKICADFFYRIYGTYVADEENGDRFPSISRNSPGPRDSPCQQVLSSLSQLCYSEAGVLVRKIESANPG